ncbi:hypothetical protein GO011_11780 [Mycobacterium sp. 20091114027_K0903767]|nr:hypothetical protein [Mycobacterium sp. 20091114027_K0903767]
MAKEDRDLSGIDALPDPAAEGSTKLSTELDAIATAIGTTAADVSGATSGRTPEEVTAAIAAARQAARDAATGAATMEEAVRILKKAAAAWRKNAPKKLEIEAAEKELADARTQLADAEAASGDTSAASDRVDAAVRHLQKLQSDLKAADEAFDRERGKAVDVMKKITGDKDRDGDSPGAPDNSSSDSGRPSGEVGTRSNPVTAKPGSAAAATPGSGKPTETPAATTTSSTSSGIDPSNSALAAALTQQNQQPQTQQAAQAQMPTMPTVPQQANQQQAQPAATDAKRKEAEENSTDILAAAGLGGLITGNASPGVTSASSTSLPPAASDHGTSLRPAGTPLPGVGLNGAPAVNTQVSHTTGNSATGLTTQSDVAGRPQGTENKPFTSSPGTSTSAAHGTASGQGTQQQATGRPMGTGMPMMPGMIPPAPAAPAARSGDGENRPGVVRYQDGEIGRHGEEALREATPGGTIAQNRDKPAA